VVGAFFEVYGDIGFFTLVAAVLLGGLTAAYRVMLRWRRVPVAAPSLCARCRDTGRFISQDGLDWPCLH